MAYHANLIKQAKLPEHSSGCRSGNLGHWLIFICNLQVEVGQLDKRTPASMHEVSGAS